MLAAGRSPKQLLKQPATHQIREILNPILLVHKFRGFFIIALDNISLASTRDANTGTENLLVQQPNFLNKLWSGEPIVTLPQSSDVPLMDDHGHLVKGYPTIFSGAPIKDEHNNIIAVITLRIDPFLSFTQVLQRGQVGNSGETYAFNANGIMISNSRFDHQLQQQNKLSGHDISMLKIKLNVPPDSQLSNLSKSDKSSNLAFTFIFLQAVQGKDGDNLTGYPDYRGIKVAGAWAWVKELKLGLTTEQGFNEALKPLHTSRIFFILFCMIIIIGFILSTAIFALKKKIRKRN